MLQRHLIQLGALVSLILVGLATGCSLIPGSAPSQPTAVAPTLPAGIGTLPTLPPETALAPVTPAPATTPLTATAPATITTSTPLAQPSSPLIAITAPPFPAELSPAPGTGSGTPAPKRVTFPPGGTTAFLQGALAPNAVDRYVLRAAAGQTMSLNLVTSQGTAVLVAYGPDGSVLLPAGSGATTWSGKLPSTQDYILEVRSTATGVLNYALQVTIPPLATPVTSAPRRITFASGATSATIQGSTATTGMDRFVLRVLKGQTMTAALTAAQPVALIIYGADGTVLISDHAGASTWTGQIPSTQDYYIDTRPVANAVVPFTLKVTVPPITTVPPPPAPKRISFPPGGTSVSLQGTTPANGSDHYVLTAQAGQTMTVNVTSAQGQVLLAVSGSDGTVLKSSGSAGGSWTGILPSTQDYILGISTPTGAPTAYTLQVTIPPKP